MIKHFAPAYKDAFNKYGVPIDINKIPDKDEIAFPKSKQPDLLKDMVKNPGRWFVEDSVPFMNKMYVVNNTKVRRLRPGDLVIVHPTGTSISRQSYMAVVGCIRKQYEDSNTNMPFSITRHEDKYTIVIKALQPEYDDYTADMSEYGFMRLEPVEWWYGAERTVQSDLFKSMAALLGIQNKSLEGMPGYEEEKPEFFSMSPEMMISGQKVRIFDSNRNADGSVTITLTKNNHLSP